MTPELEFDFIRSMARKSLGKFYEECKDQVESFIEQYSKCQGYIVGMQTDKTFARKCQS